MAMGRLKGTYICFVNGGSHFLVNLLELLYILIMIIIDYGIFTMIRYVSPEFLSQHFGKDGGGKKKCPERRKRI